MELDIEELKDEKDLIRRDMLLQKYGITPPKLTEWEQIVVRMETQRVGAMEPLEFAANASGRTA